MNKHLHRNFRRDRRMRIIGEHQTLITSADTESAYIDKYGFTDDELNKLILDEKLKGTKDLHIYKSDYGKVVSESQARKLANNGFYVDYHRSTRGCYISLDWSHDGTFHID